MNVAGRLPSATYKTADAFEAIELFPTYGWTDGLPIVPPTENLVRRFLGVVAVAPAEVIATEPVRRRRITAEKVAIAAFFLHSPGAGSMGDRAGI